ncbi:MAG: phosphoadenosine phosphosulfate reductase family protein [gamma proteobacterium endosymbiont of Lamellibrachia anaximandri]|nr:phosphoadenosine phosphosulfate reductase family protein [gamma proteobacterium endosymbiont of Lamellibrachia anaximandri]MBL3535777.1 phosphoadenosine phosphosulfate reductase family protein [gamma proteobacterium endosymbiont of Lamellibrachia anaximandri]
MSKKWFELALDAPENARHVLGISGGKDSAALAVYIKDNYPQISEKMEYFFTDTGAELQEVYDTLDKLEAYLGKPINRLSSSRDFNHWLTLHDNMLPSVKARWCTRVLKIKPFEEFVGNDPVISYVGIRADENREGYISQKETIKAVFPFSEDGIVRDDVFRILEESIGIPEYYQWRSRSGCFFCFFQRQDEWLGLKRRHPELFQKALEMEKNVGQRKFDWGASERIESGNGYTWNQSGTLNEIVIRAEEKESSESEKCKKENIKWQDIL